MFKLKCVTALFLLFFMSSCAPIQSGLDVMSDGLVRFGASIQQGVARKSCTKSTAGDLSDFSVAPRDVLQGARVTVMACYPVNSTASTSVREERLITGPDGRVDILKDEYVDRDSGFWESKFDFVIPDSIDPGKYAITQRITYKGLKFEETQNITIYKKRS